MTKPAATRPAGSPEERILTVASELFYQQGYRATGINEVIARSGVAKATFYSHYRSKEELCLAYLQRTAAGELAQLDRVIADAGEKPLERLLAPVQWLHGWSRATDYRGCAFLHMVAEIPDYQSPLRREGRELYNGIRERIRLLAAALVASDRRYARLDPEALAADYMIAFAGAIAFAELYHEDWPIEHATALVRRLIGE
ncbi:MAG: TetR/AcrR family transcriptional regulator [Gammaproteobacteria bacterium]|nr:TetR/AcrR family transcriptional regulator [Gammaproteobacteria bacterium]